MDGNALDGNGRGAALPPELRAATLQSWIGRRETRQDRLAAAPLVGLAATLDREEAPPGDGEPLPPLAHWLYFLPDARQSRLGPDGHTVAGGLLPVLPLPRRMWGGGRLAWHRPLRVGEPVERVSEIIAIKPRQGRQGPLVLVTVRHRIGAPGTAESAPALEEEHDIIFRAAPSPGHAPGHAPAPARPAPAESEWRRRIVPDPVLLFRYSALTFNGHRIHYDRPYVTGTEGYPGLVVHGPLIATLLADLLRRSRPEAVLRQFSYRAEAPLFDTAPFIVAGAQDGPGTASLWAETPEGGVAMAAEAGFDPAGRDFSGRDFSGRAGRN